MICYEGYLRGDMSCFCIYVSFIYSVWQHIWHGQGQKKSRIFSQWTPNPTDIWTHPHQLSIRSTHSHLNTHPKTYKHIHPNTVLHLNRTLMCNLSPGSYVSFFVSWSRTNRVAIIILTQMLHITEKSPTTPSPHTHTHTMPFPRIAHTHTHSRTSPVKHTQCHTQTDALKLRNTHTHTHITFTGVCSPA